MPKRTLSSISRRLLPLYIAAFLQSAVLWYAIEKLFMVDIGFNDASIGMMVAIMSVWMLVAEPLSGILADRWSRKGVVILGCVALALSALIGALSHNEIVFIISCILWGTYSALYSGTYESILYDTTMEEHGSGKAYQRQLGTLRIIEGAAFVVGALAGGLAADALGLRETFWLSLVPVLVALPFLVMFREPKLHKAEINDPVLKHTRRTLAAVLRNKQLLPVIIATVGFAVVLETIFELSQLWFIALLAPLIIYGPVSAAVFSTWALGGVLAQRLRNRSSTLITLGIILIAMIVLIISRDYWVTLAAQVLAGTCLVALGVILSQKLHDELPSKLRAGSVSIIGALTRMVIIPFAILFTTISQHQDVFTASYLPFALVCAAGLSFLLMKERIRS